MKGQFKYLFIVLMIIAILSLSAVACDDNVSTSTEGQTPIFQGITLSSKNDYIADNSAENANAVLFAAQNATPGYGEFSGDTFDKIYTVDQEKPFGENVLNIENAVSSSDNENNAVNIFIASANQDIYIIVSLYNPDRYQITSVSVNGQNYGSHTFEQGSDADHVILKVNAGNAPGIKDYTVNGIKYIDGAQIKDVVMSGEKTAKAGIKGENTIFVNTASPEVGLQKISFEYTLSDVYDLIEKSGGKAQVVLYDGITVINKIDAKIGETTTAIFEGLNPDKVYQYAVTAFYDDLNGNGAKTHVLYKNAVRTERIVCFDNVQITKDGLSWEYNWHEDMSDRQIVSADLYADGKKIDTYTNAIQSVDGLLSGKTYSLHANFVDMQGKNQQIVLDFTTLLKDVPSIGLNTADITKTGFSITTNIDDKDNVGTITRITLNGQDVDVNKRVFDGLLSDCEYTVEVTYTYDLNDGTGSKTATATASVRTLAKTAPSISVIDMTSAKDSLSFGLQIEDNDSVGELTSLILIHGEEQTLLGLSDRQATGLLSDNDYTVKAVYTYDLNDGTGSKTVTATASVRTLAKTAPSISVIDMTSSKDSLSFDLQIEDSENIGELTSLILIHGEEETPLELDDRQATGLLSDNDYTVKAVYTYDLNDGAGSNTVTATADIRTAAKETPQVAVIDVESTKDSVSFDLSITDADGVGELTSLILIRGEEETPLELDDRQATGLLSDNDYTVKAVYTYDLNDGTGSKTVTATADIRTAAKETPQVAVIDVESTKDSVSFDLSITDADGVGELTSLILIRGEEETPLELDDRQATGLLSDNDYTVKAVYTYDLNDGTGSKTVTATADIRTAAKETPQVAVIDVESTKDSVSFDLSITDADGVGELTSLTLIHCNEETPLGLNDKQATGLLSDNDYTIKAVYTYDLNDGAGSKTVTATADVRTVAKEVPQVAFIDVSSTKDTVAFDLSITDTDGVGSLTSLTLIHSEEQTPLELSDRQANGLSSYTDYTLKATYTYDLNDGAGARQLVSEYNFRTQPYAEVSSFKVNNTSSVSENEVIYVEAKIDNPNNATILGITVNGIEYPVTTKADGITVNADIVSEGQFEGGNTVLTLEKIKLELDGKTYFMYSKTLKTASVFVNGALTVKNISFVNKNFTPITSYSSGETVYMMVEFDNPTGYTINSLGSYTTVNKYNNDVNKWYCTYSGSFGTYNLEEVKYSNSYVSKTISPNFRVTTPYLLSSSTATNISTAKQLQEMKSGYYVLTQDIDLSGIEWTGIEFNGVLDGAGHTIKNMSCVSSYSGQNVNLGLFSTASGVVKNLNFSNINFTITYSGDPGSVNLYAGAIAAKASDLLIESCHVDVNSSITIKDSANLSHVGGLVGCVVAGKSLTISNSSNSGEISDNSNAGGLVGYLQSPGSFLSIVNSTNSGAVSGNDNVGGLIGEISDNTNVSIYGSGNSGNISSNNNSGGLIGYADNYDNFDVNIVITIIDAYNSGDVSGSVAGGIVGCVNTRATVSISNTYNSGQINGSNKGGGIIGNAGLFGNTIITITHSLNVGDVYGNNYSGGIVGYFDNPVEVTITNCSNSGPITGNSYIGGLIGNFDGGTINLKDCINTGSVTLLDNYGHAGGLFAIIDYGTTMGIYANITNCINYGAITSEYAGGLIGKLRNPAVVSIKNSVNCGTLNGSYANGGFTGQTDTSATVTNCYTLYNYSDSSTQCTLVQVNDPFFYKDTLNFRESAWDVSQIDTENGKYPTLKNMPVVNSAT